ncbi:hypothetical protein PHLCEN_2v1710 [Hermanssonia centrifuga]|uniref:Uncharacterized protein n=1 Tax=Hermanssonia centrifuga TaxID=98765 RepID=A0A2R6RW41_9APHY|nr:hypothetical protein PHLCEN_2v1710 [Hermanssonia centrifuga]
MGCCGEPADKPIPAEGNRITPFNTGNLVTQQPTPQSALQWQEKSIFQQSAISTPPPALQHNQNPSSPQTWGQSNGEQYNPYRASSPPSTLLNGSTVNGHGYPASSPSPPFGQSQSSPLSKPASVYAPAGNFGMTVTGRRTTSPDGQRPEFGAPSDEGKLSVSIDFGGSLCIIPDYRLMTV